MASKRDKLTGNIYRLKKRLERLIDAEYDAEQLQATIKAESDSDDEQQIVISTTTSDALLTSFKVACSDGEDSSDVDVFAGIPDIQSVHGSQTEMSMKDSSDPAVMSMFATLSKQIASMHKTADRVQKEIATLSDRLGRVERKVGIPVATLKEVKDTVVNHEPTLKSFNFNKITNEEEFDEFNSKLGEDEEYYSNIKQGLVSHIESSDPDNRMHEAMDMIFDLRFMPQCGWTGRSLSGPKIVFGTRTNILKLFADIGSNKFITVNQMFVQQFFLKKLSHAKQRLNNLGIRKTWSLKRKFKRAPKTVAEGQPK